MAMASTVSSSIATTASRFALLQVESDTDSVSGKGGRSQGANKCWASEAIPAMSKKNKKRRKKKEQQRCEISELRNLAFKKIPQKCSHGSCLSQQEQNLHSAVQKYSQEENWQKSRQRDEQLESEMFEADLEKALLLSALEYEEYRKVHENVENTSPQSKAVSKIEKKKRQGKDKPPAMTLKSFQLDNNTDDIAKKHEEQNSSQSSLHDGGFFNRLEDDGHRILEREKKRVQHIGCSKTVNCTSDEHKQEWVLRDGKTEQLKLECEKKDAETEQLKNIITQWEAKYKELKARNAKLKMMHEVEKKDKAEILLQTAESQILKNELTLQVTRLHAALEQERSKVKLLQAELSKYQKGKKQKN